MRAKTAMNDENSEETGSEDDHLGGVDDGAGCTEIWEHLSRTRRAGEETGRAETDDD